MALIAPVKNGKLVESNKEKDEGKVKAENNDLGYDQFLQLLCAEMQYQDPLEPTSNTEYVAQLATFSQMEATLGMQQALQNENANSLVGKYVIVKTTSATTGETSLEAGFVDYVQYENEQQYLYINNTRYSMSDLYQVADTEYMEAKTLSEAFDNSVAKLPPVEDLTLAYKADVEQIRTVYNSLNAYQQSYINSDSLKKFTELETRMTELNAAKIAADFKDAVGKLPSVEELTLEAKEDIEALRTTYDKLTDYQKKFIDPNVLDKFTTLEEKVKELAEAAGSEASGGDTE